MQVLEYCLESLSGQILYSSLSSCRSEDIDGVSLYRSAGKYYPDVIYIADVSELEAFNKDSQLPSNLFISSKKATQELQGLNCSNLVIINKPLIDLFSLVNDKVFEFHRWEKIFSHPEEAPSYVEWLINTAYEMSDSGIYVFNAGYQADFQRRGSFDDCSLTKEICQLGCLSGKTIASIFENPDCNFCDDYLLIRDHPAAGGLFCHVRKLYSKGIFVGFILIISKPDSDINFELFSYYFGRSLIEFSSRPDIECLLNGSNLQSILGAILEKKIDDSTILFKHLDPASVNITAKTGYVVIVTQFESSSANFFEYNELAKELSAILSYASSFVYEGKMITIITRIPVKPRSYNRIFSTNSSEAMRTLLNRHKAHACISIQTSKYSKLSTMYEITKRMLHISKKMESGTDNRLFFAEDNIMFATIDLAAERFNEVFGHNDIVYINHPNVMQLYRYDRENNQNLVVVLYRYLLNGCDISKTAGSAFMHRNTVRRKLELIRQITGIDYTNGAETTKYLFALLMIAYYERCMGLTYSAE